MKLFEDSTNIFDSQLDDLFSKKNDTELDLIMKTLSLILYQNSTNTDLVELFRLLDIESFTKVITLFDGRTIKLPSSQEFKETLLLSLIYYYREVLKLSWEEVKEKLPFDISGIRYGIKIKSLNNFVRQKMNELLGSMSE